MPHVSESSTISTTSSSWSRSPPVTSPAPTATAPPPRLPMRRMRAPQRRPSRDRASDGGTPGRRSPARLPIESRAGRPSPARRAGAVSSPRSPSPRLAMTRQLGVGLTTLGIAGLMLSVARRPSARVRVGGAAPAAAGPGQRVARRERRTPIPASAAAAPSAAAASVRTPAGLRGHQPSASAGAVGIPDGSNTVRGAGERQRPRRGYRSAAAGDVGRDPGAATSMPACPQRSAADEPARLRSSSSHR